MSEIWNNINWMQTVIFIASLATTALAGSRLIRTPTRPENDPYAETEFGENGAVRRRDAPDRD